MRLNATEVVGIVEGISSKCHVEQLDGAKLILYGSRANDQARGGDVDLLLQDSSEAVAQSLGASLHVLLAAIKKRIGDQKIALSVKSAEATLADDFFRTALVGSVVLKAW